MDKDLDIAYTLEPRYYLQRLQLQFAYEYPALCINRYL